MLQTPQSAQFFTYGTGNFQKEGRASVVSFLSSPVLKNKKRP
jgi:hypothetical protein